jgi:quinolinate synthase
VRSVPPDKEILFAPDRHLGRFLATKLNRPMTLWPGTCIVHEQFSEREIVRLKAKYPDALLAAHPECPEPILAHADHVGSTRSILSYVTTAPGKRFLIATEEGILHQMKKLAPDREYIPIPPDNGCRCNECPFMKLNTLEKLYLCLRDERPEIVLPEDLRKAAEKPLLRMLELS